jgi:acetyl esterase/lipase
MLFKDQQKNAKSDQVDVYTSSDYSKDESNLKPVIFYIHGGAWHTGNRSKAKHPCETLSKNGYVCVATSYRLSNINGPELEMVLISIVTILTLLTVASQTLAQMVFMLSVMFFTLIIFLLLWTCLSNDQIKHPDHIQDVADSFKWTVENVKQYGGDPDKICIMGHSAGGHLATLLSTNTYFLENIGVDPTKIKGCISLSGVYSDERLKSMPGGLQLLQNAFGKRDNYYDAFPIYNISQSTPPTLLINAGLDIGLKRHTLDYHYALKQAGIYINTVYFDHCTHWDIYANWGQKEINECVFIKIHEFVQEAIDL